VLCAGAATRSCAGRPWQQPFAGSSWWPLGCRANASALRFATGASGDASVSPCGRSTSSAHQRPQRLTSLGPGFLHLPPTEQHRCAHSCNSRIEPKRSQLRAPRSRHVSGARTMSELQSARQSGHLVEDTWFDERPHPGKLLPLLLLLLLLPPCVTAQQNRRLAASMRFQQHTARTRGPHGASGGASVGAPAANRTVDFESCRWQVTRGIRADEMSRALHIGGALTHSQM